MTEFLLWCYNDANVVLTWTKMAGTEIYRFRVLPIQGL